MSVYPGFIALKFNKKILGDFILPDNIICVTGSSGKGSTTKLINDILCDNGIDCIYNSQDSNKDVAIISLFLSLCKLNGKVNKEALVLEIDERYAKYIFPYINPKYVVINNLTRDQPPRQGHVDLVFNEISIALNNNHLILNGDDPYLRNFKSDKVTYFGLDKTKYSYVKNNFNNLNIVYCPICGNKLNYNFYHIEACGDYYCECGFKKEVDISISGIDYKNSNMIIDGHSINLETGILYEIYNTAAAYSACKVFGISSMDIVSSINRFKIDKKNITVLSNKAENNTTFNQSISYINRFGGKKNIVIGWKEISRRYNHFDTSWLYDIDFESLKNVESIVCVGINNYDIATRIKYSSLKCKIVVCETLEDAYKYLKNKKNIYAILNFDYVKPFNELMKEGKL